MGVSGSGKSAVGAAAADRLGWAFAEGDDAHPAANRAKMAAGTPLTDEDRWPWLDALAAWIAERARAGQSGVLTCSALRAAYRDVLRGGGPDVRFLYLNVPEPELARRLRQRTGHFAGPSLLSSQLATLEPLGADELGDRPGGGAVIDGAAGSVEQVADRAVRTVRRWLDDAPDDAPGAS